jgi:hypothetical protein
MEKVILLKTYIRQQFNTYLCLTASSNFMESK